MVRESKIIFSSAPYDIKTALSEIKRANLTISNRLRSVKQDAEFVEKAAEAYKLPLIANERCGSWYIDPANKAGSTYFKSTDGHFGQWSFSLRRLNLQVLDVVGQHGGCIIVDSTRRGKSMPDAMSKTVPIWICVLNRLLFSEDPSSHHLRTPRQVVSASEHAQIEAKIPLMVEAARSLNLDSRSLRNKLGDKPMQPVWVTPASRTISETNDEAQKPHRVVLCTASSCNSEYAVDNRPIDYVQGAADDHENWACGLDAVTFWTYRQTLLATSEDDLPSLIEGIKATSTSNSLIREPVLVQPTSTIWIANNAAAAQLHRDYDVIVSCDSTLNTSLAAAMKNRYIHLACSAGKNGSRQLRSELSKLSAIDTILAISPTLNFLVSCQTGKDLAVGAALAVSCRFVNIDGRVRASCATDVLNKEMIKKRLSWIMVSMPDASPSRATLQSVNAFLLS